MFNNKYSMSRFSEACPPQCMAEFGWALKKRNKITKGVQKRWVYGHLLLSSIKFFTFCIVFVLIFNGQIVKVVGVTVCLSSGCGQFIKSDSHYSCSRIIREKP